MNTSGSTPGTISSDVNYVKVAAFWYDARHENGTTIDDIDIKLRNFDSGAVLATSAHADDNKEFLKRDSGFQGKRVELELVGESVTSDSAGCGTNSMRVYWAYFLEHGDRDDADGPGAEIAVE